MTDVDTIYGCNTRPIGMTRTEHVHRVATTTTDDDGVHEHCGCGQWLSTGLLPEAEPHAVSVADAERACWRVALGPPAASWVIDFVAWQYERAVDELRDRKRARGLS